MDVVSSLRKLSARVKDLYVSFIPGDAATGVPEKSTGMRWSFPNGDIYVGLLNTDPTYYGQATVVHATTTTDRSVHYTNFFQGDSVYPFVAINYGIAAWNESVTAPNVAVHIGDGTTKPSPIIWGGARAAIFLDQTNKRFCVYGQNTGPAGNRVTTFDVQMPKIRVDGADGVSGSFTTVDLKTITVTGGIITAIV